MDNDNKTPLDYACENSKTNPNPIMKNILEYDIGIVPSHILISNY